VVGNVIAQPEADKETTPDIPKLDDVAKTFEA